MKNTYSNANTLSPEEAKEKARVKIVKLVFVFYFLLVFEGALRKWFLPGEMSKYIYFIRLPVVLLIYYTTLKNKLWPKKTPIFNFGMFMFKLGLVYIVFQYFYTIRYVPSEGKTIVLNTPLSLLYGWRMYFFYIPFAFIIGNTLKGKDLKRLLLLTLIFALPMSAICYKQMHSPTTARINKVGAGDYQGYVTVSGYTGTGESTVYVKVGRGWVVKSAGGSVIRTTGTFTYFHGYQIFLGSIIAAVFIAWILPQKHRPLKRNLLVVCSIATAVSYALDVTRFPTFLAGFIAISSLISSHYIKDFRTRTRARMFSLILVALGLLVAFKYYAGLQEARTQRFDKEYIGGRTHGMFTDVLLKVGDYFSIGRGLGSGTPGGRALGSILHRYVTTTYESEWQNIMWEAGYIMGVMYLYFRIWLVVWLFKGAVRATARSDNPTPLILWGFISSILLIWYITKIGTVNGYGWLFAGLCIAANRLGGEEPWDTLPEEETETREETKERGLPFRGSKFKE